MTNGDKIRQMSDEQLFKFWCGKIYCPYCPAAEATCRNIDSCHENFIAWLKQEAKDEIQD